MIRTLKILLIILIFFFGLLFLIQNNEVLSNEFTLKLNLYGTPLQWVSATQVPYYYPIIIAFALGAFLAAMYFFLDYTRFMYKNLDLRMQLNKVSRTHTAEINRLRAQIAKLTPAVEAEENKLPQAATQEGQSVEKEAAKA